MANTVSELPHLIVVRFMRYLNRRPKGCASCGQNNPDNANFVRVVIGRDVKVATVTILCEECATELSEKIRVLVSD